MNLLLSYYIDKNSIPEWKDEFSSIAKKVIMYAYKGTNGRSLNSMIDIFKKLEEVENVPRNQWPRSSRTGQEEHKQYPIPMLETKLFYREKGIFHKTAKGIEYKKFIEAEFDGEEKWVINYLFVLDSFILNKENYLITRSTELHNHFSKYLSEKYIDEVSYSFLKRIKEINRFEELVKEDYLYLNTFYRDPEFLELYFNASDQDKLELQNYVLQNYKNGSFSCCISKKYQPGGNYNVNMIKDDIKVFCLSNLISKIRYVDFESTIKAILGLFKNYFYFNIEEVQNYLLENKNIIEPILMTIYNVEELEDTEEAEEAEMDIPIVVPSAPTVDRPEPRIDDTTLIGRQQLKSIFAMRKKIAREKANFKCELEQYKGCRYFTSKTTRHNYVEVHHFIPREFRNNFENSVDVLANYITLCPHCHKMIHLATDRERIDVIRFIFNQRKDRLTSCGLTIELEELFQYYNIQEN